MSTSTAVESEEAAEPSSSSEISRPERRKGGSPAYVVLGLLLLIVGAVWLFAAVKELPYIHHPDEPTNLRIVDRMIESGDPNPRFFNYPSLFLYIHAAIHLDGPLVDRLGDESAPVSQGMGISKSETPGAVRVHRALSVTLGLLAVLASYGSALILTGRRWVSLWAAFLMASSTTLAMNAQLVTPDVLAVALVGATLWASLKVLKSPTWSAHLVAGAVAGLAASSKYNAVLVVASLAAASALSGSWKENLSGEWKAPLLQRALKLASSGMAAVAAFALTTPFSWLDRAEFLKDLRFERDHYATGHAGMDGEAASWYVNYFTHSELLIIVAAGFGLVVCLVFWKWKELALLLAFPSVYGAFIASQSVRNERTALLLLPFLAVLAAYGVGLAADHIRSSETEWSLEKLKMVLAGSIAFVVVAQVVRLVPSLGLQKTTFAQSREWINENVDPGTPILVESYSPWIDPNEYQVTVTLTLAAHPTATSWEYVIASEAMYSRYIKDEARFPREAHIYRSYFENLRTVAEFEGNGSRIRIMATN